MRVYNYFQHRTRFKLDTFQDAFCRLPKERRYEKLCWLVERNKNLGIRLMLEGDDRVLSGLSRQQRTFLWRRVLQHNGLSFIGDFLEPTDTKVDDLMHTVLTVPAGYQEYVANLVSSTGWDGLSTDFKQHPVFANMVHDPISQGLISQVKNRQGERFGLGGANLCPLVESSTLKQVDAGRVVLVNNHMLFKNKPEWAVAICLRNFVSPEGAVFIRGMFYFVVGETDREIVEASISRRDRLVMPGLTWRPGRFYDQWNCKKFDLDALSRRFPSA